MPIGHACLYKTTSNRHCKLELISSCFDVHFYEFLDLIALSQAYPHWLLTECADQKLVYKYPSTYFLHHASPREIKFEHKNSLGFFSYDLEVLFPNFVL